MHFLLQYVITHQGATPQWP